MRYSGTRPLHKIRSPGYISFVRVLKSPTLFACTGTVASNFGDCWAVNLAFSDIIAYDPVYSGKQTYDVSVRIMVTLTGVVIGRELLGDGNVLLLELDASCKAVFSL